MGQIKFMSRSLGFSVTFMLFAGIALAEPQPVNDPNGVISGSIDGHTFRLPVRCTRPADWVDLSSHDQTISNSRTIDGVEPAVNVTAFEQGFQVVVFIDGQRYKFLRATGSIDAFPYSIAREVRTSNHGRVEVDLTFECSTF